MYNLSCQDVLILSLYNVWLLILNSLDFDSDVRDNEGKTLLHVACSHGNEGVVQYLVEEVKCDVGESSCSASGHCTYC